MHHLDSRFVLKQIRLIDILKPVACKEQKGHDAKCHDRLRSACSYPKCTRQVGTDVCMRSGEGQTGVITCQNLPLCRPCADTVRRQQVLC